MNIELVDSLEGLEDLKPEWQELYRRCPLATPFQSPQWLVPWTRHLFGGGEIWALAIRQNGALIGFAPLFRWGTEGRTVSFLGAGISDYGDILFAPGQQNQCEAAVWSFLEQRRDNWDVLDLQELRSCSPLLRDNPAQPCSVCPMLDLTTYPGSMDRKYRAGVRRAEEKLRASSNLQFTLANETNLDRHREVFFQLHEARWEPLESTLRQFHTDVTTACLQAGLLKLFVLWIDDVPAAANYSLASGPTLYFYLSGVNPTLANRSPGAILLKSVIEWAVAYGKTELDFLRHPEPYKYRWGAQDRISYKLALTRAPNSFSFRAPRCPGSPAC